MSRIVQPHLLLSQPRYRESLSSSLHSQRKPGPQSRAWLDGTSSLLTICKLRQCNLDHPALSQTQKDVLDAAHILIDSSDTAASEETASWLERTRLLCSTAGHGLQGVSLPRARVGHSHKGVKLRTAEDGPGGVHIWRGETTLLAVRKASPLKACSAQSLEWGQLATQGSPELASSVRACQCA